MPRSGGTSLIDQLKGEAATLDLAEAKLLAHLQPGDLVATKDDATKKLERDLLWAMSYGIKGSFSNLKEIQSEASLVQNLKNFAEAMFSNFPTTPPIETTLQNQKEQLPEDDVDLTAELGKP